MAAVAGVDFRVGFGGHFRGDHFEMHHVVAGRCLMALGTIVR